MHPCQFSQRPKTPSNRNYEPDIETNPNYRDNEAGCNCGKNCNRAPNAPCPIAAMPVWEMTLRGWRSAAGCDHLIKWVKSESQEELAEFMARCHPELVEGTRIWPDPLDPSISFAAGLDFVLSLGAIWAGSMGETAGGELDEMTKRLPPRPITVKPINY